MVIMITRIFYIFAPMFNSQTLDNSEKVTNWILLTGCQLEYHVKKLSHLILVLINHD